MKKFIITFVLSFIGFYIIEHVVSEMFGIDLDTLNYGWLGYFGIVLVYGFKYHVICCLVPFIFTAYKCRHKKCKHEYCGTTFKLGDKVKLTEKAKDGLCMDYDDMVWEIVDILTDDVEYQIVIEVKGKTQPLFVNKYEIILVE